MFRIAKSKNDYVEYTMHITGRKKKSRKKTRVSLVWKNQKRNTLRLPQTGSMSNATLRDG